MAETVNLRVVAEAATAQAVKLTLAGPDDTQWVPRSCIEDDGQRADEALENGDKTPFETEIAEWKARQLGWD